jgi:FixJ family two-component response regulator
LNRPPIAGRPGVARMTGRIPSEARGAHRPERDVAIQFRNVGLQGWNLVLVVDDDPGILDGLERVLGLHGYEPVLFSSAKTFRNYADFEQVVCIILDIHLNDGSGIDLRHDLKATGVFVPVIYMTGSSDPAVRAAALASGCIALLTKPFPAQVLLEALRSAGGHPDRDAAP